MSEIKLCSYCKSVPQANTWTLHGISETRYFCPNPECPYSVRTVTLEQWNTRPNEDELQKCIAELETAQRWIPVSERLPEIGQNVLILFKGGVDVAYYDGGRTRVFYLNSEDDYFAEGGDFPSHWMPCPTLPEEEVKQ